MAKRPTKPSANKSKPAGGNDRLSDLQRLIDLMVEKDVVEVEIEESGARWRVRRKDPQVQSVAFAAPTMAMPAAALALAPSSAALPAAASAAETPREAFKSPMVGTFYRAASPEAEAFCKPGDRVSADTTLCILEAMKVMNEIKAEKEFEVLEVLVKNGDPVEFGQPLFLIR